MLHLPCRPAHAAHSQRVSTDRKPCIVWYQDKLNPLSAGTKFHKVQLMYGKETGMIVPGPWGQGGTKKNTTICRDYPKKIAIGPEEKMHAPGALRIETFVQIP